MCHTAQKYDTRGNYNNFQQQFPRSNSTLVSVHWQYHWAYRHWRACELYFFAILMRLYSAFSVVLQKLDYHSHCWLRRSAYFAEVLLAVWWRQKRYPTPCVMFLSWMTWELLAVLHLVWARLWAPLNTVFWSVALRCTCVCSPSDSPRNRYRWLGRHLQVLKHRVRAPSQLKFRRSQIHGL